MKAIKRDWESEILFSRIQIKSIEKARLFASLLDTIEKEFCIRTTKLRFDSDCFICPDITDGELEGLNSTYMERNIRSIIYQLR